MSAQKKIRYIYDDKGNKTDVIIPINKYENLLEDLADLQAIEDRRHEKSIPFEEVKKRFYKKNGKV
ncbi:MAG: hypothetical protein HYY52_00405 [Candidatus Melainabacteria bacterium]|nr:hypothetical protein [Candidatus Melainabacteria bacterium]